MTPGEGRFVHAIEKAGTVNLVFPQPNLPSPSKAAPFLVPEHCGPFVDRKREFDLLDDAMELRSTCAVAVVAGQPGIGRRALVRHWAGERADWFPGGQLYVDLGRARAAGALRTGDLLAELLRALGTDVNEMSDRNDRALRREYQEAVRGRKVLVVAEGVSTFGEAQDLQPAGPGNGFLAALDGGLRDFVRAGAKDCRMSPLADDDARSMLEQLAAPTLDTRMLELVDQVVARCGGLPLALSLAGGWLADPDLAPRDIIAAVTRDLSVDGSSRRLLWEVFTKSYQLLSAPERHVYEALGLLPTDMFTTELLAVVSEHSVEETSGVLAQLCNRRLVTGDGRGTYHVHPLLQQHAQAAAHGHDRRRRVHAALVKQHRAAVDQADRLLTPSRLRLSEPAERAPVPAATPQAEVQVAPWIRQWHSTVTAVIADALRDGQWEDVWRMAEGLWSPYRQAGLFEELCSIYQMGAEAARQRDHESEPDYPEVLAEMLGRWAFSLAECGRADEAVPILDEAQQLLRVSPHLHLRAAVTEWEGVVLRARGLVGPALAAHQRARQMFELIGRGRGAYLQDLLIGQLLVERGETSEAVEVIDRGLVAASEAGDSRTVRKLLWTRARAAADEGRLADGMRDLRTALRSAHSSRDGLMTGRVLISMADLSRLQERPEDEAEHLRTALAIDVFQTAGERARARERLASLHDSLAP